jgi:uncharacterized protein (UPF0332 family)
MKIETRQYLDKSHQLLAHARAILAIEIGEEAGRTAYLAAFHAAQALIFERTGKVARTHRGVHGQFLGLTAGESGIDAELRRFLSEGYKLKATADYETGPDAVVPLSQAAEAVATAERLVERLADLIGDHGPPA